MTATKTKAEKIIEDITYSSSNQSISRRVLYEFKNLKVMLDKDIFATNVYTIGFEDDSWSNLDFTKKIVTI